MDNDILSEAIKEMRGDMRKRVGKKLLTIEITSDGDEKDKPKEEDPEGE